MAKLIIAIIGLVVIKILDKQEETRREAFENFA